MRLAATLVACLTLAAPCSARAQGASAPPASPSEPPQVAAHRANDPASCAAPACHDELAAGASVHGPVAARQCGACHKPNDAPEGPKRKAYRLPARGARFCQGCHEEAVDRGKRKFLHGPFAIGDCAACHLPHSSTRPSLLKDVKGRNLCYNCHDDYSRKWKILHGPVGTGGCLTCHDPHSSDNRGHLRSAERELCLSCHDDLREELARTVRHTPAAEGCVTCHDPHGGPDGTLTRRAGGALCGPCHKERGAAEETGLSAHRPLGGKACSICHTPHASDRKKLLRADPTTICTAICHRHDPILELLVKPVIHKPFAKGICGDCHASHATASPAQLKQPFAERTMQAYEPQTYALCWSCHKRTLAEAADGTKVTAFRNGKQNLHALHVVDQQYSCRVCHEEHAGERTGLLRTHALLSTMAVGTSSPFVFTRLPNGGVCSTECHAELSYDRVHPVGY